VKASRHERRLLLAFALTAAAAVLACGIPPLAKLAIVALVALACVHVLRRRRDTTQVHLALQADGAWRIATRNGEHPAVLESHQDLGFLIALHFRDEGGARTDLALWSDAIDGDARRRLRIWLDRARGLPSSPAADEPPGRN
jgi:hypothetical protein